MCGITPLCILSLWTTVWHVLLQQPCMLNILLVCTHMIRISPERCDACVCLVT